MNAGMHVLDQHSELPRVMGHSFNVEDMEVYCLSIGEFNLFLWPKHRAKMLAELQRALADLIDRETLARLEADVAVADAPDLSQPHAGRSVPSVTTDRAHVQEEKPKDWIPEVVSVFTFIP